MGRAMGGAVGRMGDMLEGGCGYQERQRDAEGCSSKMQGTQGGMHRATQEGAGGARWTKRGAGGCMGHTRRHEENQKASPSHSPDLTRPHPTPTPTPPTHNPAPYPCSVTPLWPPPALPGCISRLHPAHLDRAHPGPPCPTKRPPQILQNATDCKIWERWGGGAKILHCRPSNVKSVDFLENCSFTLKDRMCKIPRPSLVGVG